ncbi:hypothetical protein L208DRAFT_1397373 [Tricholoma matsutake]|nr:hypothetical protein L208DRAFT_1397373 [Tricholoma matsutake 945]
MQLTNPNSFVVELEKDFDAHHLDVLEPLTEFRPRSLGSRSRSREIEKPDTPEQPDYVVTEAEISNSFLSAVLSTIQPLDEHKALLILRVTCHPAPGRRFKNSTIIWKFAPTALPSTEDPSPPISSPPKIITLAPLHSVGGWTEEQTKIIWGLAANVGSAFPGASVGVDPSVQKETQTGVLHAMTIMGSIRPGTRAYWTVEENKSSERGIPSLFQLAVVVDHGGVPFVTELDVKAELGGGLWHTFVQAKKPHEGLRKEIDVNTWKCGEVELEPGEVGWKKFMAGMTGEVSGAVVEFGQSVVRP